MRDLETTARDAQSLEHAARARAATPHAAAAALALALGKLCADEGLDLAELTPVVRAAHDATLDARRLDA